MHGCSRIGLFALALAWGISWTVEGAEARSEMPPNVVILFADDLGYGDLSSYGHPLIRTPHLDRMARDGVRLTSFYAAAPSCTPSRAALLTGRYPQRTGLAQVLGPDSRQGLREDEVTLAQLLKPLGYRTAAFGKWHLGHDRPEFLPAGKGFDTWSGLLYSNDMIPPWVDTRRPLERFRDGAAVGELTDQSGLTDEQTEDAISFLRSAASQPFFLYVAYSMPHVPLSVAPRMRGRSRAGLYGDVIEAIDDSVGRILATLTELELDERTVVLFTSDNGPWQEMPERMFAQNLVRPWHAGSAGLLRGAKGTTWEGGQRVPAIFRWTGRLPAGEVRHDPITAMDVLPTIAALVGAALPAEVDFDGMDVFPCLNRNEPPPERPFFYVAGWQVEALRRGAWKLRLTDPEAECSDPASYELFHLEWDPGERHDRSRKEPEVTARMCQELMTFRDEVRRMRPATDDSW